MYLIREVFHCKRGMADPIVEALKVFNGSLVSRGNMTGKIYVDATGRMDTVISQHEVENLHEYYKGEREADVSTDERIKQLLDSFNENTVDGFREIYEVIL